MKSDCILISDFCLTARNRGTAALGYGAISFLRQKGYLTEEDFILSYSVGWHLFRPNVIEEKDVQGHLTRFKHVYVSVFEYGFYSKFGITFGFLPFGRMLRSLKCVAAINGGDGFSDIYGKYLFNSRNPYSYLAMKVGVPLIFLPQTIGPFKDESIKAEAVSILRYAKEIYVRDTQYTKELDSLGIKYELTNDLSAFMQPEPWNIDIKPYSIGINVSGLAYSNKFLDLAGQFEAYPELMDRLICHFRDKGKTVYIIPHAYGYYDPEENNDDMIACREAYQRLADKTNVILIDGDYISPQIKYVISKMSFFIGTRMHANFAAIFTKVPVFGMAYSLKFAGAFETNGIYNRVAMINNIKKEDIDGIIAQIDRAYSEDVIGK